MGETRTCRGNVPAEISSLVGRREELGGIAALVARSPLVTLTGGAGVGKTRLALGAAGVLGGSFPDGAWFAELSAEQNGALVGHRVAAVLGLPEQAAHPQAEVLAGFLADRRLLLVLDTCDHLRGACAELLRPILDRAPHVRVIATCRRPLGVPGERVLRVGPLDASGPGSDAVRLLGERARAAVPGLTLDEAEATRICRLLDGVPLAIELAARRLRALSARQIADRLDDRLGLLTGGGPAPFGRHRTLRTAVGWSHELCSPAERLLWARLSVFPGDFGADDARAVCGDEALADPPLDRLAEASLLERRGDRYRMLGMTRDYGGEWLRRLGEEDTLRRRHRDHYLAAARRAGAEWYGPRQREWAAWTRRELPNLRAALDRDDGPDLPGALWFAWCCLGLADPGRRYLDRSLRRHTRPGPARTLALWARAQAALSTGDATAARAGAAEAYEAATAGDDPDIAGRALQCAAAATLALGDPGEAGRLVVAAFELLGRAARDARDDLGLALTEVTLARTLCARGAFDRAVAILDRRARRAVRGELWTRAEGEQVRSLAELGRGDAGAAETSARAALDARWRLGDGTGAALAMEQLAAVAARRGDGRRAAWLLGASRRAREDSGASVNGVFAGDAATGGGPAYGTIPDAAGGPPGSGAPVGGSPGRDGSGHGTPVYGGPVYGTPGFAVGRERTERRARALAGDAAHEWAFARGLATAPGVAVALIRNAGDAVQPPTGRASSRT
ncbi:ATP-binding protein [Streptosporangium sandarakinum]|uniref:ATP-binding protein n=1 Tax=Streptosporangium sandarakinum TaxID=1260955 RepID=UPI003437AC5F